MDSQALLITFVSKGPFIYYAIQVRIREGGEVKV